MLQNLELLTFSRLYKAVNQNIQRQFGRNDRHLIGSRYCEWKHSILQIGH